MNKLDELIGRIRLLMPHAELTSDVHEGLKQSHWLAIRVHYALILCSWHPGKGFTVVLEGDEESGPHIIAQYEESVSDVVDFLVKYVIRRGLV